MLKKDYNRKLHPELLLILLPAVGIASSYIGDTSLLLIVFLVIAMTPFIAATKCSNGKNSERLFVLLVFSVSLTLLLSQSLSSDYLLGWDVHQEYSVFLQVSKQKVWQPRVDVPYNSLLSVTVLPAVISAISGLSGIAVFKVVFPVVYSIVPIILFKLYRRFLRPVDSFLSVFLFMAYQSFYVELVSLARQEVAELLLLLFVLLLFVRKIRPAWSIPISLLIVAVGVITAHYSITYILLFLMVLSYALARAFGGEMKLGTLEILLCAGLLTMLWYAFLSAGSDLITMLRFLLSVSVGDFFNPASRPTVVYQAIGVGVLPGLLHDLNRMTYYVVNLALIVGFVGFLLKRGKSDSESKILSLAIVGMFLVGCAIILPNFASGLNFSRFYHIALLFVSPCFVYGTQLLSSSIGRLFRATPHLFRIPIRISDRKGRFLAPTILFLFLLFDSGWVWAVSMDRPTSFLLDSKRLPVYPDASLTAGFFSYYTVPEDIAGARWLTPHLSDGRALCADYWSRKNVLTSYGEIPWGSRLVTTYFLPYACDVRVGYVYLSALNTNYGIGASAGGDWQIAEILPELSLENIVYSAGGTTIYASPW